MIKHFRFFVICMLMMLVASPSTTFAQTRKTVVGDNELAKVKPYNPEAKMSEKVRIPEAYQKRTARTSTPFRKTLKKAGIPNPSKVKSTTKSGMQPILKAPDGTELWGNVIYASSWENLSDNDLVPYSISSFNVTSPITLNTLFENTSLNANGSGAFLDGKFHFITYGVVFTTIMGTYYQYDVEDWNLVTTADVSDRPDLFGFDTDLDPVTGRVYGCFYDDDFNGKVFGYIDYETKTRTKIASVDRVFYGIAINAQGEVYGINDQGNLYKIDKETGALTLIGSTGLQPHYIQSATFDRKNNKLYWAACFENTNSGLYEVNTATGAATKVADFPDNEEIVCLTVPAPAAEAGAPAKIEDLAVSYPKGTLDGNVTFTAPTLTYSGATLTDASLTYSIQVNEEVKANGTVAPGEVMTVPLTLTSGGNTTFTVSTSNAAGRSPLAKISQWIGPDNPKAPSAIKLNINEDTYVATVTWRAPTAGVHSGYVNGAQITYDVIRYPGRVQVATKQTGTSFTETLASGQMKAYYYEIVPYNGNLKGISGYTEKKIIGEAFSVPYVEYFNTEDDFNLFTVIDSNKDGITWGWSKENGCAYCSFNFNMHADDWLITPEIYLEAGRKYNFQFSARRSLSDYSQRVSASFGKDLDPSAYTEIIPLTEIQGNTFEHFKASVRITEEGNYHFAIHDQSIMDAFRTYVDSIIVTAGPLLTAPDTVTNLKLVADPDGYGEAVISFNAPIKDMMGNALTNISKIEIYRTAENTKLIHTIDNPSPGAALSYTDANALNGYNTYTIVGYAGTEKGEEAVGRVYVGYDIPKYPNNIRLSEENDAAKLTWAAPDQKGVNGGYVDLTSLTYNIYNLNLDNMTFNLEAQDLTGSSHLPAIDMQGNQDLVYYGVTAVSEIGESDYGLSNLFIKGASYRLPFVESFKNGNLDNGLWWVDTERYFSPNAYYTADDNIGSADWMPSGAEQYASFNSGKITLQGSVNPILHFSHRGQPRSDYRLTLNVMTPDGVEHAVKTIDYRTITGDKRWIREEIDLNQFKNEKYIILMFLAETHESETYMTSFDAVELYDILQHNLYAQRVNSQLTGTVGEPMTATVKVRNIGQATATDFNVNLYLDNELVATVPGETLEYYADSTYTLTFVPKLKNLGKASVHATVDYANDLDLEDNTTLPVDITIKQSELPVVDDLVGMLGSDGVTLAWSEPESDAKSVTEDFENYEAFSISDVGEWTLVDKDGLRTIGIQGNNWKNMGAAMAYIVFAPQEIGYGSVTHYKPHSGKYYMASFASYTNDEDVTPKNDDWLISPELDGYAQTVSFYAKAASQVYGPESFEILYSTTDKETSSFTRLAGYTVDASDWYEYIAELPEGTKYFAIRCISEDKFAFFVDDISYHKGTLTRTGYNIYRDGVLIGSTSDGVTTYKDAETTEGYHVYTVTVVYTEGESPMSNEATVTNGIEETATAALDVRGETGQIRILNAENKQVAVYTVNGSQIFKGAGHNSMFVPVPRGIYLVKVDEKTFNISVK